MSFQLFNYAPCLLIDFLNFFLSSTEISDK